MKKVSNKGQKRIKELIHLPMVFGLIGLTSLLLTGCFSSWALSPRDKSIKEWEAQNQNKNEKSSDSIQGSGKNAQKVNASNFNK